MGVEKSKATRGCHDCGGAYSGKKKTRWLSLVHFIVWLEKYWGRTFHKWMVTLVGTDEWMIILLAMSTGKIKAHGPGGVQVTVQRIVGGASKFLLVYRAFTKIGDLEDGSDSAWPTADFQFWNPDENDKVRLFVLVYLLSGCDFLPAISGLPFKKMWVTALQSVRTEGVFTQSLFVQENDVWSVRIDECIKLLATMFFFMNEAAFSRGERTAAIFSSACTATSRTTSTSSASLSSASAARGQLPPAQDWSRCASRASGPAP
ncbi:unnamed protein product [Pylaiella littoralis]